jgi:glycosyltransferase involved in cell wall biosynthesis
MPTLLAVNNYYYSRGGAETVFFGHNRLLEAAGWNVVPFAMRHPKNLETPWSKYFVDEIEFGGDYSLAQKLVRAPKIIYSFEARTKLQRLLDAVDVDICHVHNLYHHISPSILGLLKRRGIPVVLTLHDLKIACPAYNMLAPDGVCERCRGGRLYNVVVHRCIKGSAALSGLVMLEAVLHRLLGSYRDCVSRFIVPSRFYIEKLCEWGMPRALFQHVPNFVDVQRYIPVYAPGSYFIFFGRIAREKGVGTLIRAAASAGCTLHIVGTGPELQEMQKLAAQLKANVTFRGHLSGDALHEAVRNARAAVLPSEWYENAPMSALEAYALGKPVIGARIGGIPELINEDVTGATFASGDAVNLAAVLTRFASYSSQQIEDMGRAGRQWVEGFASADVYRQRMLDTYRELRTPEPSSAAGDR